MTSNSVQRVAPIHKATVLKTVRTVGEWKGYISPSKVAEFHIMGGWHLGCEVIVFIHDGIIHVDRGPIGEPYIESLVDFISIYEAYNCNSELGYRIRFWEVFA